MKPRAATYLVRTLAGVLLAALLGGAAAYAQAPSASGAPASAAAPSTPPVEDRSVDIRDIRGPEPIASAWLWAIWTACGLLLAGGAYFTWRCYRRRTLAPAVKLPYETALARLEAARALMWPDSVRAFSITVSDIVRLYIEQRFQVRAAQCTTEEFLYGLLDPSEPLLAAHRALLAGFLNHCDLAKFGGFTLSPQEMQGLHESARTFVLATGQPAPAAASPASAIQTLPTPSADKDIYDSVSSA